MDLEMLELIEEALDSTLRELQSAHPRPRRKTQQGEGSACEPGADCGLRLDSLVDLSEIVVSPAVVSLRAQLHRLGWLLFRHVGTTQQMQEIAEWVALLDVAAYEFRAEALQGAFAGVGTGENLWA